MAYVPDDGAAPQLREGDLVFVDTDQAARQVGNGVFGIELDGRPLADLVVAALVRLAIVGRVTAVLSPRVYQAG